MQNFFEGIRYDLHLRTQPWTKSGINPDFKYYDFRTQPEIINEVLEDFKPFDEYPSVQSFYDLIKWINSDESIFETNDCRLDKKISINKQQNLAKKEFVKHGALGFFFRNLKDNISPDTKAWSARFALNEINDLEFRLTPNENINRFVQRSQQVLNNIPALSTDCLGLNLLQVHYENLPNSVMEGNGFQFIWRFWVWGDSEKEIFNNFQSTVNSMSMCLRILNNEFR